MDVFDRAFFRSDDKERLELFLALSAVSNDLAANSQFVALRLEPTITPDNVDSFVVVTSANPSEQLIYTSPEDVVDLNIRDGGFF